MGCQETRLDSAIAIIAANSTIAVLAASETGFYDFSSTYSEAPENFSHLRKQLCRQQWLCYQRAAAEEARARIPHRIMGQTTGRDLRWSRRPRNTRSHSKRF